MSTTESTKTSITPSAGRSPQEVIKQAQEDKVEMVDFKFCDLLGTWHHFAIPVDGLEESTFSDGVGFDGSSIPAWKGIHESDMLLIPDPDTAVVDPFFARKTLSIACEVMDPVLQDLYIRDPRGIARRAEEYLRSSGVADTCFVGPECEFFVFDSVSYELAGHKASYAIDSVEGHWNSGKPGLGYLVPEKGGYFPAAPQDTLGDLRAEMVAVLKSLGIEVEAAHHEVASAGQCEIDMKFSSLLNMADQTMLYKYVIRNVAREAGKVATFMPKPIFGDNGSGMHTHLSLWKDGETLFYDDADEFGLSEIARAFIAGVLKHAPALLAFCAPTTNSYRRLVPGYEAPVNLVWAQGNRSAAVRIPMLGRSPKAKRMEFRCPDPTANPYLAFSALLMAGLDGISRGLDCGEPSDYDLFEEGADAERVKRGLPPVETVPGSLDESLRALEEDHDFLLAGDVFSEDLIQTWVSHKRETEVDVVRLRPHPAEFALYFGS
jgi:glutamine synthetase